MRIWTQTLLPPAISMTLYFIIFGNLIGPRIGIMGGFSYMEFIAPGYHHDVDHQQRLFQRLLLLFRRTLPAPYRGNDHRARAELDNPGGLYFRRGTEGPDSRSDRDGHSAVLYRHALALQPLNRRHNSVVLTSVLFSLGGFLNGIFANNFDDISIIPTFVLTPLIYLGGVFYSIDLLPRTLADPSPWAIRYCTW